MVEVVTVRRRGAVQQITVTLRGRDWSVCMWGVSVFVLLCLESILI